MQGGLAPSVDSLASYDAAHTTYRLKVTPDSSAQNIYSIFGTPLSGAMRLPAAYQCADPFGVNTGGTSPAVWATANDATTGYAQYDSWLTVGITDGDTGALGTVGIDFGAWTESAGLTVSDGAVFWMQPDSAPSGETVVAQVTLASGADATVVMGVQGRSAGGARRCAIFKLTGRAFTAAILIIYLSPIR